MNATEINLEVKSSVFNPALPKDDPRNKVSYRQEGDVYYYKVWLWVEGYDLPYVDSVTYSLDPSSFPEPDQIVPRTVANPNCQLTIWTWGLFTVVATIIDKKSNKYQVSHQLNYKEELPSDKDKYESPETQTRTERPVLVA